jgi:hypothetical protein
MKNAKPTTDDAKPGRRGIGETVTGPLTVGPRTTTTGPQDNRTTLNREATGSWQGAVPMQN